MDRSQAKASAIELPCAKIELPHQLLANMIQVAISPSSLLDEGVCVEEIDGLRLFKFTETLQARLENLLVTNETNELSDQERAELDSLNELDRFFTYLNARLLAPQ
jgi:hypothetical protein